MMSSENPGKGEFEDHENADQWLRSTDCLTGPELQTVVSAIPQIVSALTCVILFEVFELLGVRSEVAWILRLSGLSSCFAAYFARKVKVQS